MRIWELPNDEQLTWMPFCMFITIFSKNWVKCTDKWSCNEEKIALYGPVSTVIGVFLLGAACVDAVRGHLCLMVLNKKFGVSIGLVNVENE